MSQLLGLADRALLGQARTDVACRAQELGVRIAHVEARQPALAVLAHHGVARQAVLHLTTGAGHREASQGGRAVHRIKAIAGRQRRDPVSQAGGLRAFRYIATIGRADASHSFIPPITNDSLMLELAILGLLQARELHGYEIRRRLHDDLGLFVNVSFGSLYPALARLERGGAVEAVADTSAAVFAPMTGSLSGERAALRNLRSSQRGRRSRKVYRITDEGRRQFAHLLDAEPAGEDPRGFGLRLAFARHLPPAARLRLLERRRAQLAAWLAESAAMNGLDSYARSLAEHTRESTERDISWLDRLISAERSRQATIETGDLAPPTGLAPLADVPPRRTSARRSAPSDIHDQATSHGTSTLATADGSVDPAAGAAFTQGDTA